MALSLSPTMRGFIVVIGASRWNSKRKIYHTIPQAQREAVRNESEKLNLNPPFSCVAFRSCVMSWDLKFPAPIAVPRGKPLVTLRDAASYITTLPAATQQERA